MGDRIAFRVRGHLPKAVETVISVSRTRCIEAGYVNDAYAVLALAPVDFDGQSWWYYIGWKQRQRYLTIIMHRKNVK